MGQFDGKSGAVFAEAALAARQVAPSTSSPGSTAATNL